jgi:hypothetical protein
MRAQEFLGTQKHRAKRAGARPARGHNPVQRYHKKTSTNADEKLDELSFLGSPCTKDCSGHRAGYAWSQKRGGSQPASWSDSFNRGAALFAAGK